MKHVVLISCVKGKKAHKARCRDLYDSDLFRKSLAYAEKLKPSAVYVLSAKHGLLDLDEEIDPYEQTLKTTRIGDVRVWAERVLEQLRKVSDLRADRFTFLAAERYRRFLAPHMPHHDVPMQGLGIGRQLQFLKERAS